jgi:RimJ/RimL family protein N-acetyltransferase
MTIAELKTDRLLLRQWRDDDLIPWAQMNADPLVREYFPAVLNYQQSAGSMERFRSDLAVRGWGWWAVEERATGGFIGFAGIDPVEEGLPFQGFEVGWRLTRSAWGQGYATEAGHACLDFGFDVLKIPEILAVTAIGNQRSRAVMHRLGMTHDPADDFDDPTIPVGPLRRSVLYRLKKGKIG